MLGFIPEEWEKFTRTEKAIIILARLHGIATHEEMRHWLMWPLPEIMNKRTYEGHWGKLQQKMRAITACRKDPQRIRLSHAATDNAGGSTGASTTGGRGLCGTAGNVETDSVSK